MLMILLVVVILLQAVVLIVVLLLQKRKGDEQNAIQRMLEERSAKLDAIQTNVDARIRQQQAEQAQAFKMQREELGTNFQQQGQMVRETMAALGKEMQTHFLRFQENVDKQTESQRELMEVLRKEMQTHFEQFQKGIDKQTEGQTARGKEQSEQLANLTKNVGDQLKLNREEQTASLDILGKRQQDTLKDLGEGQRKTLEAFKVNVSDLGAMQMKRFAEQNDSLLALRKATDDALREMRTMIESKLKTLQEENGKKLEEMRVTVDEKLQSSVKDRFDHSFKLISGQLESVQKGLGEMQTLALGVGDLKKVLSNVKTRGNLGEIQLGTILEDILTPEQYVRNAHVDTSTQEVVEFAVKLPGQRSDDQPLLLPIDSKFPIEDYQRLQAIYEQAGSVPQQEIDNVGKQFENAVKKAAKDIYTKYVKPPVTTDFALLFVPTEGLYAEVLQRPGLFESLRRDFKVIVVGPSNVAALLSSLQMGFRTLAIQQRSNEVWELLRAVKTEFGKFGDALASAKKRIMSVGTAIEGAERRTRAIDRKLRHVQELPAGQSRLILGDEVTSIALDDGLDEEVDDGERDVDANL